MLFAAILLVLYIIGHNIIYCLIKLSLAYGHNLFILSLNAVHMIHLSTVYFVDGPKITFNSA